MTLEERVEALERALAALIERLEQPPILTLEEQHQRSAARLRQEKTEPPSVL